MATYSDYSYSTNGDLHDHPRFQWSAAPSGSQRGYSTEATSVYELYPQRRRHDTKSRAASYSKTTRPGSTHSRYIVLGSAPNPAWALGDPLGPLWDASRREQYPNGVSPQTMMSPTSSREDASVRCVICDRLDTIHKHSNGPSSPLGSNDSTNVTNQVYSPRPLMTVDRAVDQTLGCICMPVEASATLSANVLNTVFNVGGLLRNTCEGLFRTCNRAAEHGLLRTEQSAYKLCERLDSGLDRCVPPPMVEVPNQLHGCAVHGKAGIMRMAGHVYPSQPMQSNHYRPQYEYRVNQGPPTPYPQSNERSAIGGVLGQFTKKIVQLVSK